MSKKRGKLNKQIKKLFDQKGFEEGIEDLEDELLLELTMFASLQPQSLKRSDQIKALRRFWATSQLHIKKALIKYLNKRLQERRQQEQSARNIREEKITQLAGDLGCSDEEIQALIEKLSSLKSKKITPKKVANTLEYIRFQKTRETVYEQTGADIDQNGGGEFLASFAFAFETQTFHKQLQTTFEPTEDFAALDEDKQIAMVQKAMDKAAKKRQQEIDSLTAHLQSTHHPYLSLTQIIQTLQDMDPADSPDAPKIDKNILQKLFAPFSVTFEKESIVFSKIQQTIVLENEVRYTLSLKMDASLVHAQVFNAQKFDLQERFEAMHRENKARFLMDIDRLQDEMLRQKGDIQIDQGTLHSFFTTHVIPDIRLKSKLQLRTKIARRVLYYFNDYVAKQKHELYQRQLLKKTIKDFKNLFPVARGLKRKLIFHMGPTNSGKTHQAMQKLKQSDTGYYLAPLRLLALEGYEKLRQEGINCSLITGEEEIVDEESTHISSTIEMMNYGFDFDCCVIDEVQMLADRDRGWAWVNAIIGAGAKEVYLTGSPNALEAIKLIAQWLDEELEVVEFKRKNPLEMLEKPVTLQKIQPQTAVIAFSRKEVLALKQKLSSRYEVSVVYGNLSPEVRREEARRFREGQSQVLIATDAISMGLNLPIKTIVFSKDSKFDGQSVRLLKSDEVIQIAGRAGRFGLEEKGYIAGMDHRIHQTVKNRLKGSLTPITPPFTVMANLNHARLVATILQTDNLHEVLEFFAKNMRFDGPFVAKNLQGMMQIAAITDGYELSLEQKYHLSCAPVAINSPYIESRFHEYILSIEQNRPIEYHPLKNLPKYAGTEIMLLKIEDRVKEISLYLWLSFKFPELFIHTQKARENRKRLNTFIENSLKHSRFVKRCKRCGRALDYGFAYNICDRCFQKGKKRGP